LKELTNQITIITICKISSGSGRYTIASENNTTLFTEEVSWIFIQKSDF